MQTSTNKRHDKYKGHIQITYLLMGIVIIPELCVGFSTNEISYDLWTKIIF